MITKPVLITDQDVFSYVSDFLLNQGEQSVSDIGDCSYLSLKSEFKQTRLQELNTEYLNNIFTDEEEIWYRVHHENPDSVVLFNFQLEFENSIYNAVGTEQIRENYSKCAVGCLIDLEHYTTELEGKTTEDSLVIDAVLFSNPELSKRTDSTSLMNLLRTLQDIHDRVEVHNWGKAFDMISAMFNDKGEFSENYWDFHERWKSSSYYV